MRSKVPLRRLQIALLLLLTFSAPRLAAAGAPLLLAEVVLPSETAAGFSRPFAISDDGRFVLLASTAPNLIAGQAEGNNADDLFLRDRASGEVLLVSHRQGQPLHTADESASAVTMSPDGA